MHILILGCDQDAHAAHLKQALEQAGAKVDYWDTQLFPTQACLSWQPHTRMGSLVLPGKQPIDIQEIHSIFWRSFTGVQVPSLPDSHQQRIAFNDSMSMVRSFFQGCPVHWVNSWKAYQFHKEKPLQLSAANQLGVTIPATLVSNDPVQVAEFARTHEKTIFKPVYGGAHTRLVTEAHLEPERLRSALSLAPITLQEYIPGINVRSYVIGEAVYAAEIRSDSLDFREDLNAQLVPLELPETIKQQCRVIAQRFWLEWTAIDWRVRHTGEYVFLEANPSPMFIHFERQTGFPITQQLVNLLVCGDRKG